MKKWHIVTIGITSAAVLMGCAAFGVATYLDRIHSPNKTHTEPQTAAVNTSNVGAMNNYNLSNYKFEFQRYNSLNGQRVQYNGETTLIKNLPDVDLTKAIDSAVSDKREALITIGALHDTLSETIGMYKNGAFQTEGYGHSVEVVNQTWDGLVKEFEIQPEIYLRVAHVIGNDKVSQDIHDVLTLLTIALEKRDIKGMIYAHRIVHDIDDWVYESPDAEEGDERYGASRAMPDADASKLAEIAAYIKKYKNGSA